MIWLEVADLVVVAGRTLELNTGQVLDLLDPVAAEVALAQARPRGDAEDPAWQAAALLRALVQRRPLRRGNQQVALAAMLQLLALNGWEVDPEPAEATRAVVAGLSAGRLDTGDVLDWLAPRLRRLDRATTCAKETPMRRWKPITAGIAMATMRRQPKGLFQRFTDRARRAVHLAQEEARLLRHNYVGTEHLLLGLLYEGEGVAAQALGSLGISLQAVRGQVEQLIGRGPTTPTGHIPFTPRAKKVLELSLREALALGHNYIGTEHLLLGLVREGEGVAAQVLARFDADHARLRELVLGLVADDCQEPGAPTRLVRVSVPAELVEAAERLAEVRRLKEAAFDAGDLDSAAALRDQEKQLLADKLRLERQLTAGVDVQTLIAENQRMHRELERLRELLRQHGIEPNGGNARTA
jgi:prophage maintenance system killer protein